MFFLNKYNEYKKQKEKQCCRKVTEQELDRLNHKIVSIYTLIFDSSYGECHKSSNNEKASTEL